MPQDLIATLRDLDPWPFMAGLFLILWVVEVRFGGRATASKQQIMQAKMDGYALCEQHLSQAELIKAEGEGYLP